MRWISDRQSAENSEVSVISIIETIIAGVIAYFFYRWTDKLWHIGLAACLSPFLLLRTSRSIELSLHAAEKIYGIIENRREISWVKARARLGLISQGNPLYATPPSPSVILVTPLIIGIIKLYSTVVCLITHPIECVGEIPRNWQRVVLCTDIGTIPELIPTIEQTTIKTLSFLKVSVMTSSLSCFPNDLKGEFKMRRITGIFRELSFLCLLIILDGIPLAVPGLAYRYAVKSTALIWSPLLWAVRPVRSQADIKLTMSRILTR